MKEGFLNNISVVIPFFQRKNGILSRALLSIQNQSSFNAIEHIIVVDDGSPISAHNEISQLDRILVSKVKVISQANAGVSKARNAGLDYLHAKNAQIIAFLDSDDVWEKNHITEMLAAFECGADFYFSNFYQLGQKKGAFERAGKINYTEHKHIEDELFLYSGGMVNQILTGNLIGTPTVAFNAVKFSNNRFQEDLSYAGEDYFFWLDIATTSPKIVFSKNCNIVCGEGVNIFSSAKWGTIHLQARLRDEILFRDRVLANYNVSNETRDKLNQAIASNEKSFLKNAISTLKAGHYKVIFMTIAFILKKPKILLSAFR